MQSPSAMASLWTGQPRYAALQDSIQTPTLFRSPCSSCGSPLGLAAVVPEEVCVFDTISVNSGCESPNTCTPWRHSMFLLFCSALLQLPLTMLCGAATASHCPARKTNLWGSVCICGCSGWMNACACTMKQHNSKTSSRDSSSKPQRKLSSSRKMAAHSRQHSRRRVWCLRQWLGEPRRRSVSAQLRQLLNGTWQVREACIPHPQLWLVVAPAAVILGPTAFTVSPSTVMGALWCMVQRRVSWDGLKHLCWQVFWVGWSWRTIAAASGANSAHINLRVLVLLLLLLCAACVLCMPQGLLCVALAWASTLPHGQSCWRQHCSTCQQKSRGWWWGW
jgi:hypothetical protein